MTENEIYAKNLEAIKSHIPYILQEIDVMRTEDNRPDDKCSFDFITGRDGSPNFVLHEPGGGHIHGHSMFDPVREAETICNKVEFGKKERVIVLGFGFGHLIREILRRTGEGTVLIVVEPFISFFEEVMRRVDISDIINSNRVLITFALDEARLSFVFNIGNSPINVPEYRFMYNKYLLNVPRIKEAVLKGLEQMRETLNFNYYTGMYGGPWFLKNTVENFRIAYKSPGVYQVRNLFRDKPVFVVAPGPSLEKNVDQLKRVKGKALIIACDSAVRPLLKHGIEPDCICTIDFQEENMRKLEGVDTSFAYMFPAIEVTPGVPKRHKGRIFTYYHDINTMNLYDKILGTKGQFGTGGSVLSDAFHIALGFGGDPIVFVGVDLGFPGMKWYADGSFEGGEFTEQLRSGDIGIVEVPDIHGNPMPTYRSFAAFINYFNSFLPNLNVDIIDATEGGALLRGTKIATLADTIDEYVTPVDRTPMSLIDEVYDAYEPIEKGKLLRKLDKFTGEIKKLSSLGLRVAKKCAKGMEMARKGQLDSEMLTLLKSVKKAQQDILRREEFLSFYSPMLEKRMHMIFAYTPDEDATNEEKIVGELWMTGGFFGDVCAVSNFLMDLFGGIKKEIEEEAKS